MKEGALKSKGKEQKTLHKIVCVGTGGVCEECKGSSVNKPETYIQSPLDKCTRLLSSKVAG